MGRYNKRLEAGTPLFQRETLPPTFKVARNAALQLSKLERDLFTDIEEAESGNYIVSGITKQVSELDFTALSFGLSQKLYNQSYQWGNEDINSGIFRNKENKTSKIAGCDAYKGFIKEASLSELCRLSYGTEPTTELKKKVSALLETLDKKHVEIRFPNGDKLESKLCIIVDKLTRKDGAILYNLYLHPIFGLQIRNQFGELPQDVIATLDNSCKERKQRKQAAHYLLLRWLSVQDKRFSHTLTIDTLIQELRMEEYFKKDRGKAEKQLLSVCDVMKDIGILSSYNAEYGGAKTRRHVTKITFNLNPNYIRTPKGDKKEITMAEATPLLTE